MTHKQKSRIWFACPILFCIGYSSTALAHGYMEYPAARQEICAQDGGYWGASDGSQIPNTACRAAFIESGWYPFVQKPEFARLVSDYRNQAAVELAVPDGALCSAADSKKSGVDLPSPTWQKTAVALDTSNQITIRYRAETPHNPSFWQFYLSKPGFDSASQVLTWADLELIDEAGNVPTTLINGLKYYEIPVTLPTGRSGDAVLYSRWQRIDPAGEGFYNCSDISFGGDPNQPEPPATWTKAGSLLQPTTDANSGDTVWFRVFDAQGQELIFEKLAISANNQSEAVWAESLALAINATPSPAALIGTPAAGGAIIFDPSDLYANAVYLADPDYSFRLEIKSEPTQPPVGNTAWSPSKAYNAGDTVTYQGQTYTAQWWTKGEQPGAASVWLLQGDGSAQAWNPDLAYQAGDSVTYQGNSYQAKWWTKGDTPTTPNGPWQQR
ncbi:spindolin [Photobacterium sanctipauli]|uniref:Spindolin n=1 Tax=Photobacterium sanctipauli TaxID=1342794 RepID=A0A2T3NQJ7_9GAMM|nr:lytic polysaccharide monooxygenase [Photobacterium sanctipauli]PSW18553.1 spindolin [Photobacterium sanctipauli]